VVSTDSSLALRRIASIVRTDSLVERREFEPPVLFVVRGAYGRPPSFSEVSALKPIRELFSEQSGGKFGPKMAGDRSLSKGEKAKEDRQFESVLRKNYRFLPAPHGPPFAGVRV
jgi:hypothetical protein